MTRIRTRIKPQTLRKASTAAEHIQRRYSFLYSSLFPPSRPLNPLHIARWSVEHDSTVSFLSFSPPAPRVMRNLPRSPILTLVLRGISLHRLLKNISKFKHARRSSRRRTSAFCYHPRFQTTCLRSQRRRKLTNRDTLGFELHFHARLVERQLPRCRIAGARIRCGYGFHHLRVRMTLLGARFIVPFVVHLVTSLLQAASDISRAGQCGGPVMILLVLRCQSRTAKQEAPVQITRDDCGPQISTHSLSLHPDQRAIGVNNTPRTCVLLSYPRVF